METVKRMWKERWSCWRSWVEKWHTSLLRLTCYLIPPSRVFVESGSKCRCVLCGYFLLLLSYSTWTCEVGIFCVFANVYEGATINLRKSWGWSWIVMNHQSFLTINCENVTQFSLTPLQKRRSMLIIEHVIVNTLFNIFSWVDVFWVFVLWFAVNHLPFIYTCLIKIREPNSGLLILR
jgi:hypothetical protein